MPEAGAAGDSGEQALSAGARPLPDQVPPDDSRGVRPGPRPVRDPYRPGDCLPVPAFHRQPQASSGISGCSEMFHDGQGADCLQVNTVSEKSLYSNILLKIPAN